MHGPAIDQILVDEHMDLATGQTDTVLWPLTDNLGTVRDLAEFDAATGTTSVVNHISYDSFDDITAESNSTIDRQDGKRFAGSHCVQLLAACSLSV